MLFGRFLKRNMLLYFRDRTSVFFSLLSTLIVLGLMIAFLGDGNINSTLAALGTGMSGERQIASNLIIIWTIAGIIVVNAVSVSMTLVGLMVRDEESHKMAAFFVAPVKRSLYVTGYVVASVIVAFIMCVLTFVVGEAYIYIKGGEIVSFGLACQIVLIILAIIFSSAAFVFLCATAVHTNSAFTGLTTVMGTLIGFLAAIYVPYGAMPETLRSIIKFIPAFQGSSAIRQALMESGISWFACDEAIKQGYSEYMGLVIKFGDTTVPMLGKIIYMFAAGVVLLIAATAILSRKKQAER